MNQCRWIRRYVSVMHYCYTDIRAIWPDNISASTLNNSPLSSVTYLTSLSASAKFQLASKCQPSFLSPNLDSPNTYARIVFIGYSSAFNIIIPDKLFSKLRQLSMNSRMCKWILSVLLDRPQVVKVNTLLSTSSWTDLRWSRSTPFCHSP